MILLIDEYDVPVAKANSNGYYNEMLEMMKGLLQALKDINALMFLRQRYPNGSRIFPGNGIEKLYLTQCGRVTVRCSQGK